MLIFAIIGLVGLGFLIAVALLGTDHDIGHDFDTDHDLSHEAGPSPFSIRVIALFLTAFGASGTIARAYDLGYPASSGIGILCGLVVGFVAYKLIGFFMSQAGSSTVAEEDLAGKFGQISVTIPAGGIGQIGITAKGKRLYLPARAVGDAEIDEGAEVEIVRTAGNQVFVTRTK